MRAGRKILRFGSHLPRQEKVWIVKEINQYLSTIEAPYELSGLTAKINAHPQGIEIVIPIRDEWYRPILLFLWLLGWSAVGAIAIWKLLLDWKFGEFSDNSEPLFIQGCSIFDYCPERAWS